MIQRGNRKLKIKEEQTMKWPKQQAKIFKTLYTEN